MYSAIVLELAEDRRWPAGLGPLKDVPKRYPTHATSAAAHELTRLAAAVDAPLEDHSKKPPEALMKALKAYIETKPSDPIVEDYLMTHSSELRAIREYLLAHAGEIEWATNLRNDAEFPNLVGQIFLARLFAADALTRRGDPAAWDDIHAMLLLVRTLSVRWELISQRIATFIALTAALAMRRLPGPVPRWFPEFESLDFRRSVLAAGQADVWVCLQDVKKERNFFFAGYYSADVINVHRRAAARLMADDRRPFDVDTFSKRADSSLMRLDFAIWPSTTFYLASAWNRVAEFEASRTETLRILKRAPVPRRSI